MADVKGDIAGIMNPGADTPDMQARIQRFGLAEAGFQYTGYPVTFWDLFGQKGIQLRTTISEMGPLLLSRILGLNDTQSDILTVIFKIADDNNLLLTDTKDLKAILAYVDQNSGVFAADYGKISSASVGVIPRDLVALETHGGDVFFGEPGLNINDWLSLGEGGKGMINILDSSILINNGKLYSTFLLWLLSELFEALPEVGDMSKPKLVFFFDEAHLLFHDAPRALLDKIEQVVKLIRSKGVGVYFCTQNPRDIPDGVLAQLGNKIEHGLRAYTPADQKAVRAAADSFRVNPEFNTYDTLLALGTGEAVVSFLGEDGIPGMAEKAFILPPRCCMGAVSDYERDMKIKESLLYSKYANPYDGDSAYEFLQRKGVADREAQEAALRQMQEEKEAAKLAAQQEKEAARQAALEEKAAAKLAAQQEKEAARLAALEEKAAAKLAAQQERAKKQAIKSVGNSVVGTVGRELGKSLGKSFGSFGKTLGGNVGASLGRGLLSTFLSKK
jgi:DNA helicase HerA-like ATPase